VDGVRSDAPVRRGHSNKVWIHVTSRLKLGIHFDFRVAKIYRWLTYNHRHGDFIDPTKIPEEWPVEARFCDPEFPTRLRSYTILDCFKMDFEFGGNEGGMYRYAKLEAFLRFVVAGNLYRELNVNAQAEMRATWRQHMLDSSGGLLSDQKIKDRIKFYVRKIRAAEFLYNTFGPGIACAIPIIGSHLAGDLLSRMQVVKDGGALIAWLNDIKDAYQHGAWWVQYNTAIATM
jgi:hypothetical protein